MVSSLIIKKQHVTRVFFQNGGVYLDGLTGLGMRLFQAVCPLCMHWKFFQRFTTREWNNPNQTH